MFWVYILLLTAGVVLIVPTVLRAKDGLASDVYSGFFAFYGLTTGLFGLLLPRFGLSGLVVSIASLAIGLAMGAIHPEIIAALRPKDFDHEGALLPATDISAED